MATDFNFTAEIRSKIDAGMNRAHNGGHVVTLSKMSGKLDGIVGISTNPLINSFCEKMQSVDGAICQHCYSCRLLTTARKSAIPVWTANTVVLTDSALFDSQIPKIPDGSHVRFNPHGELTSDMMLLNFYRIARRNPTSKFVLFTKRLNIVRRNAAEKPENVSLVASTYFVDDPLDKVPEGFDVAFNVVTPDFADAHGVKINCAMKCSTCLKCWKHGGAPTVIYEKLK